MTAYEFLKDYFNDDEYFIIARKFPKDSKAITYQSIHNINDKHLEKFLYKCFYLNRDNKNDIYFTLNSYKKQTTRYPKRSELFVEGVKGFYFDIDKEVDIIYPKIIELFGYPSYKITSSQGKYQLIYKFDEPYRGDISKFKQLLKAVVYNFHPLDKLFDTARLFRLAGFTNKKIGNDNYKVYVEKFGNLYTFERFEKIASKFSVPEKPQKKNTSKIEAKIPLKSKTINKSNIGSPDTIFVKYEGIKKIINRKYKELLNKYNQDYSTADLAYARWLRTVKQIDDDEVIIKKLFEARGYTDMMDKHGYQIEYYIENILKKSL